MDEEGTVRGRVLHHSGNGPTDPIFNSTIGTKEKKRVEEGFVVVGADKMEVSQGLRSVRSGEVEMTGSGGRAVEVESTHVIYGLRRGTKTGKDGPQFRGGPPRRRSPGISYI